MLIRRVFFVVALAFVLGVVTRAGQAQTAAVPISYQDLL
jgi:hypothetical protein